MGKVLVVTFILLTSLGKCQSKIDSLPRGTIEDNFEGGKLEFTKIFTSNIKYPKELKEQGIFGIVYYALEIDTLGEIKDFKIIRSPAELMSKEVEAKIYLTDGRWKPMILEKKAVNYIIVDYVYFELR